MVCLFVCVRTLVHCSALQTGGGGGKEAGAAFSRVLAAAPTTSNRRTKFALVMLTFLDSLRENLVINWGAEEDNSNLITPGFASWDGTPGIVAYVTGWGELSMRCGQKSQAALRTASSLNYWGFVCNKVEEFAVPLQGFVGNCKSTPISCLLKGLNNCKLNVNQTLLGIANTVLC